MLMRKLPTKLVCCLGLVSLAGPALADEGGVSFWLPGQYGSLAAVPGTPGWALPLVYYHGHASADANVLTQRGNRIAAGVDAKTNMLFAFPTYTFAQPVLGGQAALAAGAAFGHVKVEAEATLSGPGGAVRSGAESDSRNGFSDVFVTGSLKWNHGVHNTMAYLSTNLPVGTYNANRLANLGLNHWSIDGGGGYTYLDPRKGHEFSAVVGVTRNFENEDTDYRNGTSAHLDWAASQFVSKETHVGVAGYFYHQLTGDKGAGARLGSHKSRIAGIGPQVGHSFDVRGQKWYVNLKGYYEFNEENRPKGWNLWVSLAIPL